MLKLVLAFFAGSAMSKILVFALLPIYTRLLEPSEYGYYDLSITYLTIIASMIFLDVWVATMRFMHLNESLNSKNSAILSGLLLFSASTLVLILTGTIMAMVLAIPFLWLIVTYGITSNLKEFYGFVARGLDQNFAFTISGAVNTIVMVALNVLLLVVLHWDLSALYIASIIANLAQCIILEFRTAVTRRIHVSGFDRELTLQMLRFALPLGLNSVSYWLLTGVGKIVVQHEMSIEINGYFAVGSKFGALVVVISGVFTMAWQDIAFSRGSNVSNGFYRRASSYYLLLTTLGLVLVLPATSIAFPILVGDAYSLAFPLIPSFLAVAALGSFSTFVGNIFYALNRTNVVFYSTVIACAVNLILCVPFVQLWGVIGANAAIAIGFVVGLIVRSIILARLISFGYRLGDLAIIVVTTTSSFIVYSLTDLWLSVAYIVLVLIVALVLYRNLIKSLLAGLRRSE